MGREEGAPAAGGGGGWEVGREERRGIPNPRLMIPCRREIMDVFL